MVKINNIDIPIRKTNCPLLAFKPSAIVSGMGRHFQMTLILHLRSLIHWVFLNCWDIFLNKRY